MSAYIQTGNLQKGDLCIYSVYGGVLRKGIYAGPGSGTYQFFNIDRYAADRMKEGKKPPVTYISGSHVQSRVAKVTTAILSQEEIEIYEEMINKKTNEITDTEKGSN